MHRIVDDGWQRRQFQLKQVVCDHDAWVSRTKRAKTKIDRDRIEIIQNTTLSFTLSLIQILFVNTI